MLKRPGGGTTGNVTVLCGSRTSIVPMGCSASGRFVGFDCMAYSTPFRVSHERHGMAAICLEVPRATKPHYARLISPSPRDSERAATSVISQFARGARAVKSVKSPVPPIFFTAIPVKEHGDYKYNYSPECKFFHVLLK